MPGRASNPGAGPSVAFAAKASPDDRAPADSRPVQRGEAQLRPAGVTLSWLSLTQLHLDRWGQACSTMRYGRAGTHLCTGSFNTCRYQSHV